MDQSWYQTVGLFVAIAGFVYAHGRWISDGITKKFTDQDKARHSLRNDLSTILMRSDDEMKQLAVDLNNHKVEDARQYVTRDDLRSDMTGLRQEIAKLSGALLGERERNRA